MFAFGIVTVLFVGVSFPDYKPVKDLDEKRMLMIFLLSV